MVDQESGTYRPRRAFIEPDVEPAPPERPAQPTRNGNGRGTLRPAEGRAATRSASTPVRPEPGEGRAATRSASTPVRPEPVEGRGVTSPARKPVRSRVDEDQPKTLYRDDMRLNGSSRP